MSILSDLGRLPGMGSVTTTTETNFLAAPSGKHHIVPVEIVSTAADAGNTPTTTLRAGLLLGRITATGLVKEYNVAGTDGSEICIGALYRDVNTLDLVTATAGSRITEMVVEGVVYADQLFLLDEAARRQLYGRFVFLDRLQGVATGPILAVAKSTDYTVVNGTDNGKLFYNTGAAVFTLPTTIKPGSQFRFFVASDNALTITAPAGKLIVFNNIAATSIAFSTSSEKVGASVEILALPDASKYMAVVSLGAETQTPTIS